MGGEAMVTSPSGVSFGNEDDELPEGFEEEPEAQPFLWEQISSSIDVRPRAFEATGPALAAGCVASLSPLTTLASRFPPTKHRPPSLPPTQCRSWSSKRFGESSATAW